MIVCCVWKLQAGVLPFATVFIYAHVQNTASEFTHQKKDITASGGKAHLSQSVFIVFLLYFIILNHFS